MIGYFDLWASLELCKRFLGSASAHRSIRCGVALRRLLPVLPPVSDVLLGRRGGGVPRVGQCLCFVDQAKRPIEQLRRFLATRSNGHRHKQTGPTWAFAHVGRDIVGPRERPELPNPSLRPISERQCHENAIALRWVIDFHLAGRIDNGHSQVAPELQRTIEGFDQAYEKADRESCSGLTAVA